MCDGSDAIGLLNAQFLSMADDGGAGGERAGYGQNGKLVD